MHSIEEIRSELAAFLFIYGCALMSGALCYGLTSRHRTVAATLIFLISLTAAGATYYLAANR